MASDKPDPSKPSEQKTAGRSGTVPAPAVRRLSLYLRELEAMLKRDHQTTSSIELGATLGYTDAQVRKDLAHFGQFGHPGVGYRVIELISQIRAILGTDRTWNALVIGAGNLGQALATYNGFANKGFQIVAVFDNDPQKIGQHIRGNPQLEILPMDRLENTIADRTIELGITTVPADVAQKVADLLVAAGIKGILNFSPVSVTTPDQIPVACVELAMHLEQLAFRASHQDISMGIEM